VHSPINDLYLTPVGSSPAEMADLIKQESERWRQLIAATGLKGE
jgi:tripartite-type tricarboxylate transporter receptor subunit TctC